MGLHDHLTLIIEEFS